MNINIKTDPELLDLLRRASKLPPPTEEQLRLQRQRWIIAEMGMGDDRDEAAYFVAMATGNKVDLARLDREAESRMNFARAYLAEAKP